MTARLPGKRIGGDAWNERARRQNGRVVAGCCIVGLSLACGSEENAPSSAPPGSGSSGAGAPGMPNGMVAAPGDGENPEPGGGAPAAFRHREPDAPAIE